MKTKEIKELEQAYIWAKSQNSPEVQILTKEIDRRENDHSGNNGCCYETLPENRPHPCTELNLAEIPVAWIEYDQQHGFELVSTNAYGDGSITSINFCPFCGKQLIDISR